jgi:hypothetical protein
VATKKLSQIAASPAIAGVNTRLIGYETVGPTDYAYTVAQVITAGGGSVPGKFVTVADFLGVGGLTDLSIQAAIDFAFNNDISRVIIPYIPSGRWTINNPIFQDPPGNLRGSLTQAQLLTGMTATPTIFGPYISVEADYRTRFYVTFQTAPAWWIGPGGAGAAGHRIAGVNLTNSSVDLGIFYPRQLATLCEGFAIHTGGGIGTTFVDCSAHNFYAGWVTGPDDTNGSLAEGNKWYNCTADGCYIGIWLYNGQGLVNTLHHCNIDGVRAFSSKGPDYLVLGGEHGHGTSQSQQVSISSTSALSSFTDHVAGNGAFTNYSFTTTIASPFLPYWTQCPDGGFVLDVATVVLPGFGIVPLVLTAFNTGTHVATYKIWPGWVWMYYGADIALSATNFQTQLQAATTLGAVERCIYFEGPGHLINCHYENNASCTALWDTQFTIPGDNLSLSGNCAVVDCLEMLNANPPNPSGGTQAVINASQAFPWIRQVAMNFTIRDTRSSRGITSNGNYIFEGYDGGNDNSTFQFVIERCPGFVNVNLRYVGESASNTVVGGPGSTFGTSGYDPSNGKSLAAIGSRAFGFGEWDRTYWGPATFAASGDCWRGYFPRAGGTGTTKFIGYKPAPGECQRITLADVAAIKAMPDFAYSTVPICARSMCIVEQLGAQTYSHVKDSAGDGFSYYSLMNVSWSYVAGTHLVTISNNFQSLYLFNGLEIGLDNGGGTVFYIVTGTNVYQTGAGTITVYRESVTNAMLAGTIGTTYTGAFVQQRAPSLLGYGATVAV